MKLYGLQFEVDPHVHTVVSGHSWSTLSDYVAQAKHIGMKGFCVTEHGPATPNGPPEFIPQTQMMLPHNYDGISIFRGLEADIIDFEGKLDVRNSYLEMLEFCIASIHSFGLKGGTANQNIDAYMAALSNPHVDMIGHPDVPQVPCSLEALVLETKKYNKLIEINTASLSPHRKNCRDNLLEIARLSMHHEVRICVSSDAHCHTLLGSFGPTLELLDEICFPSELIVNYSLERFQSYIDERKSRVAVSVL